MKRPITWNSGVLILALLLVMGLTGCEKDPVAEMLPTMQQDVNFTPFAMDESAHLVRLMAEGTEEDKAYMKRLQEEAYEAQDQAEWAARQRATWAEADAEVRRILAGIQEHPMRQRIEQMAAHAMLNHQLMKGETSPQKLDAVGYYTDLLIDNRSPDASMIMPALAVLELHWPEDEIASRAQEAAALAEAWLARNPCEECLGKNAQVGEIVDARQRRIYLIQDAVSVLAHMAQTP